ncbi:MAG TPA: RNA polymerase sigma-54 factor [Bacteroidetes bacterium]|nr:MAG: RNA polymerase sigma-54 factor [Ignavibacteria bacterium GWA2_54_16]HCA80322.1 RNA polymerase sigma-54 factor [Bacteroidota bacterium]
MINLSQQMRLGLKLTPQQVQYLKLLQLPTMALEQRIKTELEVNPLLETVEELEQDAEQTEPEETPAETPEEPKETAESDDSYSLEDYLNDDLAGYKSPELSRAQDEEEEYERPIASTVPMSERLLSQLRLQLDNDTDFLIAEEIIGNVDEDGYLRRDLELVVQDLNLTFGMEIPLAQAEQVIKKIQLLDPPGIAARNLQECLIAQVRVARVEATIKELALKVLQVHFEDLKLKRFENLSTSLHIGMETLKKVIELIQHLNPKPGEGEFSAQENYITPDFIVENDEGEFIISLHDRNMPSLRINKAYRDLVAPKGKKASKEAKDFIKQKFEAAKWFIASIHQRRETLLKVMRAIVERQRQWFEEGEVLKPMIYKDIAEVVGVDISTISRVVNSKYVQTEFGVHSLKEFFTSGLETDSGEDVSNQTIKQRIKDIISVEDPKKPLNDDRIAAMVGGEGVKIARRTVAKYREQMGIPIARLRKKI